MLTPDFLFKNLFQELCEAYQFETAVVHFDETGQSLGTGEVTLKRKDADRMIKELKGISIDGRSIPPFLIVFLLSRLYISF